MLLKVNPMPADPFNLSRFIHAQETSYYHALNELKSGKKRTHWIWWIFPQLRGLGCSANAEFYGLTGLAEAQAYLAHPTLGARLKDSIHLVLANQSSDPVAILGDLDALKLKSCLTLFRLTAPADDIFCNAIKHLFNRQEDPRTLDLLG
jgi:uncharacterized protein (DUF1810 family)